jgi:hypothetical protein
MHTSNTAGTLRRSSRVPMTMPITITSLEPTADLFEVCETLVVNAHGCALRSPIRLDIGVPLQFRGKDGRETTAHVVDCQPIGANQPGWKVAARLDLPGNFWGLPACPEDWMRLTDMPETPGNGGNHGAMPKMPMLRALVSEMIEPLQAELTDLTERLTQQKQRNRFEVSLSHIPPEVEEKLWMRLREDLATQALRQSREQTEQVLKAAQSAIELKITEAQEEFRGWVREQLQGVTQQAQTLSEQTANGIRQQFRTASEQFEQQAATAGSRLQQQGQEFLDSLLVRLGEEREAYRRELEAVQVAAAGESSRLQTQLTEMGRRMAELDETAQRLETGLNTRLMKISAEIVAGARTQLESAADSLSQTLIARNGKEIAQQLEEATSRLQGIQGQIASSVSESLRARAAETLETFNKRMDDSAHNSVGRWRVALSRDLTSVANILGQSFRSDVDSDGRERQ